MPCPTTTAGRRSDALEPFREEQLSVKRRAAVDVEGDLPGRDAVGQVVVPVARLRAALALHVRVGGLQVEVGLALLDEIGRDLRGHSGPITVPITAAKNRLNRTAAIIIRAMRLLTGLLLVVVVPLSHRPVDTRATPSARDRRKSGVDNRRRHSGDGNAMERGPRARRRGDAGSHPRRRLDGDARERHDGLEGEVPGRPALGRAQVRWAGDRQRLRGPRLRRHGRGRRLEPVNRDAERSTARRRVAFHTGLRETQRRLEDDRVARARRR